MSVLTAFLSPIWPYIAGLAAVIIGALGWRRSIRREVKQQTALEAAEEIAKKHERMNHAATGIGATDDERIDRLRRMAEALDK